MKDFFNWLLHEKFLSFAAGCLGGITPGIIFILDIPPVTGPLLIWTYFLKLVGAVLITFSTGLAAALASDAYKWAKQKGKSIKLIKRKNKDDDRPEQKTA